MNKKHALAMETTLRRWPGAEIFRDGPNFYVGTKQLGRLFVSYETEEKAWGVAAVASLGGVFIDFVERCEAIVKTLHPDAEEEVLEDRGCHIVCGDERLSGPHEASEMAWHEAAMNVFKDEEERRRDIEAGDWLEDDGKPAALNSQSAFNEIIFRALIHYIDCLERSKGVV